MNFLRVCIIITWLLIPPVILTLTSFILSIHQKNMELLPLDARAEPHLCDPARVAHLLLFPVGVWTMAAEPSVLFSSRLLRAVVLKPLVLCHWNQ